MCICFMNDFTCMACSFESCFEVFQSTMTSFPSSSLRATASTQPANPYFTDATWRNSNDPTQDTQDLEEENRTIVSVCTMFKRHCFRHNLKLFTTVRNREGISGSFSLTTSSMIVCALDPKSAARYDVLTASEAIYLTN